MRPSSLYHACLHWVSPGRARAVIEAQKDTAAIPEAIVLRLSAAPAGTALCTTTAAVLESMASCNALAEVKASGVADVELVQTVARKIKTKPHAYHRMAHAFQVAPVSAAEKDELARAKEEAVRLAPICQGYIDALMKNAALGKAKALLKHAEQSPIIRKKAATFFKALGKSPVKSLKSLLTAELEVAVAPKGEG